MGQGRDVRWIVILICLTTAASLARGQEQEGKLVDRLLRPDMSLANSAQNKKFTAVEGTSVDRKFVAKSFYAGEESNPRSFGGLKDFLARTFGTRKFARGDTVANAHTDSAYAAAKFRTRESSLIRTSSEEKKTARVREYAENKPFLGQGTRQKILSQQDKPLSIDEVRELLNKN